MSSRLARAAPPIRRRFAPARRACVFWAAWLIGCTDGSGDSNVSDTGLCTDGYDVFTFLTEHAASFCNFVNSCVGGGTPAQCAEWTWNLPSEPCYQPCNAGACMEQIQGLTECTSYAEDAAIFQQIVHCSDSP